MSTQVAQELTRIENAKILLGQKAEKMSLVFTDPEEGGTMAITENSSIEDIAATFDQIDVWDSPDLDNNAASDGIEVSKDTVYVSKGYYSSDQQATVQGGSVPAPTITIDEGTGEVTASLTPTEGYVLATQRSSTKQLSEIVDPAVIKDGTNLFGVEGTFTEDASIPTSGQNSQGEYESDHLPEGCTVYAKGVKVHGTMTNMNNTENIVYYDPITEDTKVVINSPARVKNLSVQLKTGEGCLLERLRAI